MSNEAAPSPSPVAPPAAPVTGNKDERMWAVACHLAAFIGYVVPMPFAGVVGPLVVWLIKRDEYPLVQEHGKESLNFQISVAACYVVGMLLIPLLGLGLLVIAGLALFNLICIILATIKANEGQSYRYPVSFRIIK